MAELSLVVPVSAPTTGGKLRQRTIYRIEGTLPANTPVDINNPGLSWVAGGENILFSDSNDFVSSVQVFRNGQLLDAEETASGQGDVYPVFDGGGDTSKLAFEFPIIPNDNLQVWRQTKT